MLSKSKQRKLIKERLNHLCQKQKDDYAEIICSCLNRLVPDEKILSYFPLQSEADITSFNLSKDTAYPVTFNEHDLEFYTPCDNSFTVNRYGISEPNINSSIKADCKNYRYIIVPLLGFDDKCHRLGHGKGYYDYYLQDKNLIRIGVAFEAQKLDEIAHDENDVAMDYIVTEKQVYTK